MEMHHFKTLLGQTSQLAAHYKKVDGLTGENFNIFRILKLGSSEVRLHSAFLAALLDPKGAHGQEGVFLKLFIQQFCFRQHQFDTEYCRVEIEKHTGFISGDGTEGGRIDIIITDAGSGHHIIIENKIYAGDQKNQLARYHSHSPSADLMYLTLLGKDPDKASCGILEKGVHFKCLSYKSDILSWLEDCRKEVAVYPIVRESITQYINLIKHLTHQTPNHQMEKEVSQLIKAELEASFIIANNLDNALMEIFNDFFGRLQHYCAEAGLECTNDIVDLEKNHTGIWIWKPEWKYLNIGFQFQNYDKKLIYGFVAKQDPDKVAIPYDLRDRLGGLPDNLLKANKWWPWSQNMEAPYDDWGKYEPWGAMTDGDLLRNMQEKIKRLSGIVNHISL